MINFIKQTFSTMTRALQNQYAGDNLKFREKKAVLENNKK